MGVARVSDDAIWLKHIEGDSALSERIRALPAGTSLELEVGGVVGRWERMRDGRDGRPTFGIKPVAHMRDVWARFRKERANQLIDIREVGTADPYLVTLRPLLEEWDSAEDDEAYRDL